MKASDTWPALYWREKLVLSYSCLLVNSSENQKLSLAKLAVASLLVKLAHFFLMLSTEELKN